MKRVQIGLYDPVNLRKRVRIVSREYKLPADQALILRVIKRYGQSTAKKRDVLLCLGVFPVKSRKVVSHG